MPDDSQLALVLEPGQDADALTALAAELAEVVGHPVAIVTRDEVEVTEQ